MPVLPNKENSKIYKVIYDNYEKLASVMSKIFEVYIEGENVLEEILKQVQRGTLSVEEAKEKLATFENLGFAKIDHHRKKRQGFPEVVYGEGKTT